MAFQAAEIALNLHKNRYAYGLFFFNVMPLDIVLREFHISVIFFSKNLMQIFQLLL